MLLENPSKKQKNKYLIKYLVFFSLLTVIMASVMLVNRSQNTNSPDTPHSESETETEQSEVYSETICISPQVPNNTFEYFQNLDKELKVHRSNSLTKCDYNIERYPTIKEDLNYFWSRLYVPVVKADSKFISFTNSEFENIIHSETFKEFKIIWSEEVDEFIQSKYNSGVNYNKYSQEEIHELLKSNNQTIAIIPFEEVLPRYRVIHINNQTPLSKTFNKETYPLIDMLWASSKIEESEIINLNKLIETLPADNYNSHKLTEVILTGTSVVGSRKQLAEMQKKEDHLFPIRNVAEILKQADIAHISNEASFSENCTQTATTLIFCGTVDSFEQLEFAGIDAVGITGNHIRDYGKENLLYTLKLYDDNGITYFGGGRNREDAHKAKIIERNGIKFAFLGYNFIPPKSYLASDTLPGNTTVTHELLEADIKSIKDEADFIIVDMQWGAEYQHTPVDHQIEYGRAAINYGADIINGVHPHWVQEMEYHNGGYIYYGLGNFLFDQTWSEKTREGIMVKHYFYNKEYLGAECIPTRTSDSFQVEVLTGESKIDFLSWFYSLIKM